MTIWSFLRAFQLHSSHIPWRPRLASLLEGRAWDSARDIDDFIEALREHEFDVARFRVSASGDLLEAEREESRLRRRGILRGVYADSLCPRGFRRMADPPLTLTYWGDVSALGRPALSVVGSREPRAETLEWMDLELGEFLTREEAVLVSGGARGVDQRAHQLALRAKRPTMVVLPSGVENAYPSTWKAWQPWIERSGGCLVSEYPAAWPMRKNHFHHRNRLIAAWGLITLVVEARVRSGTLITAMRAAELGRPLCVLPGAAWDPAFEGNLQLLSEGATLLRQAEDLALFWRSEVSGFSETLDQVGGHERTH